MIRVTTPRHTFTFPTDASLYSKILVTYSQQGKTILEKTEADMAFENDGDIHKAYYRLSQEETKAFVPKIDVKIQVRVKTAEGTVMASEEILMRVKDVLDDEIL